MNNFAPWLAATACVVAGPLIVAYVQGYWALLMVPTIQAFGATTQPSIFVVMALFNAVGALLAAAVLSLPLGLLARSKPWVLGAAVGLVVTLTIAFWVYPAQLSLFIVAQRVIEALAFVAGCAALTSLVSRFRRHHAA
jgi:hypothetical protein